MVGEYKYEKFSDLMCQIYDQINRVSLSRLQKSEICFCLKTDFKNSCKIVAVYR